MKWQSDLQSHSRCGDFIGRQPSRYLRDQEFCSKFPRLLSTTVHGQRVGGEIHQSPGRHEVDGAVGSSKRLLAILSGAQHFGASHTHPGAVKRWSGLEFASPQGYGRLASGSLDILPSREALGPIVDGSICIASQQATTELLQLETRSGGSGDRRLLTSVVEEQALWFPAILPHRQDVGASTEMRNLDSIDHPMVGYSTMVPIATRDEHGLATVTANTSESTHGSGGECSSSHSNRVTIPSSVADFRGPWCIQGISQTATTLLAGAWAPGTRRAYQNAWKSWAYWCMEHDRNPVSASVTDIMNFLTPDGPRGFSQSSCFKFRLGFWMDLRIPVTVENISVYKLTSKKEENHFLELKNMETLSNFLRSVVCLSPEDFLPCIYLSLNRLGPAYEGLELGIGETILMKAVAQATGRQLDKIKTEAQEKGDLGLVAECSRSNQRTMFKSPNLTASGVYSKLKEIARMSGNASMIKKIDIIKGLFVACRLSEARYIARSLGGKLRIGLAEQSVLSSISQAVCLTPPRQEFPPAVLNAGKGMSSEARKTWIDEQAMILKQTFCQLPNYDVIIPALLEDGIENLPKHCRLTPGVPLKPMLAHPTRGIGEVLKRFEEAAFTCEYKYDGERAQIHILESSDVHIYSRNQENNTSKYPDIISRIPKVKKESVKSCIIDAEAVAWDPEKKQIQPFQILTTRKRKDVDAAEIKVQVCVYAFDMLYLNGESLVKESLLKRRRLLRDSFLETEGEFMFATYMDTSSTDEITEFLDRSIKDSCEGLMVKTLEEDATYEIAKRSHNWLKLKKDYLEGVGDTLDLVVIGAYLGKGKRTGMYGGFLLATYDEESEEYQTICKIGTGFTDEDLEKHYNFLKDHVIESPRCYYRWDNSTQPDHWFDPIQVWEVKCADLSISPVHKAALGLVEEEKGISLRFPRFIRIRDDKKPEEATNSFQVADLYRKQQQIQNTSAIEKGEEEFY
ncbi:DNA ligase 1 [Pelodytes ibericus]